MECSKCKSERSVKNGFMKGSQRYKCKECGCNYTVDYSIVAEKEKKRRFGLSLYLEGLGFHSIGRLLNVTHAAAMNWIKTNFIRLSGQKNYRWVWTSVDREARQYVDFFLGNSGTETGKRLWDRVKGCAKGAVMTDYWKSYNELIPSEKLIQSKAETYTV